jgi:hypothetical protein
MASWTPLGRAVSEVGGFPYYLLSYPVSALPDGALLVFTEIQQGDEVILMTGSADSLVSRAGRAASVAVSTALFEPEDLRGALLLYCAGCMLGVQERMPEVVASLRTAVRNAPFLGAFTLGEQGGFIGVENRHGNLMIAVLVFGAGKTG